jgi:uncharacterized protein
MDTLATVHGPMATIRRFDGPSRRRDDRCWMAMPHTMRAVRSSESSRGAATPVAPHERIELLDAIRGVALGGILLANLTSFFGADMLTADARAALPWSALGALVLFGIDWLVEGKFYSVFSMLLGVGFALQRARAAARGNTAAFDAFFRRRMTVLVGIGLVHMLCVWSGDILMLYGVMGLLLPALSRIPARQRAIVCAVLLAVPLATHVGVVASRGAMDPRLPFASAGASLRAHWGTADRTTLDVFARGSSADYYAWNAASAVVRPGTYLQSGRPARVLALFLIGAWLGAAVLPRLSTVRQGLWVALVGGAMAGIPFSLVYASIKAATRSTFMVSAEGLTQTAGYMLGTTPLAIAYLAAAALLWQTAHGRSVLAWFVPLGRMALTVYLGQSLVQLVLFTSLGMRLAGRLSLAWLPIVAAVILLLQRHACVMWLRHRTQGPAEWLWRRATYGSGRTRPDMA